MQTADGERKTDARRRLQELADEIEDPVGQWRLVAAWKTRALGALRRLAGEDAAETQAFGEIVEDLRLPAPSLAEAWDLHEFEQAFHRARGVLLGAADRMSSEPSRSGMDGRQRGEVGLTPQQLSRLVNRYIGVQGGYLGDFSYRTHADFYPEFCNLEVDPYRYEGTTRERFIEILRTRAPRDQAKIVRGVIDRFPVGGPGAPSTRTIQERDALLEAAERLESGPMVSRATLDEASDTVRRALQDADVLVASRGPVSALDRMHTAMHGYLSTAAAAAGVVLPRDASTTALWKAVRTSHPRLQEIGPRGQDIQKVLNACSAILDAFDPVRNKASLAHPNDELLGEAEAVLVINVARSLLVYLDARFR